MADGSTFHAEAFAADPDVMTAATRARLRGFVARIEELEESKAALAADLKEVFAEAKGEGYDTKVLRKVVRLRRQDQARLQEEQALLDLYLSAIGGL